jgi:hypothetical protein
MITFVLAILAIFFFSVMMAAISMYSKYQKDNEELKKKISEYEESIDLSNRIAINSTGFYKHVYYDEHLKIPAMLFIHFRVSNKDVLGGNFKFDFDFERFNREHLRKNTKVEFDSQSMQFLRLKEHQWHKINSEEIIWSEFKEEELTVDDFKFQEPAKSLEAKRIELELTDYEKNDINCFLKFSTIPEETKDSIKKILKI